MSYTIQHITLTVLVLAIMLKAIGNIGMAVYRLGRTGRTDTRNLFEALFAAGIVATITYLISINS